MAQKQSTRVLLQKAKKFLWLGSMVFVTVWLFQTRHTVQSRQNVDKYMLALERNAPIHARTILDTYSVDDIDLLKRLQGTLSPQVAQCALESLIDSDDSYLTSCDEADLSPSDAFAFEERPQLAMHFLKNGAKPSEDTLAFALGRNQADLTLFCLENRVFGKGIPLQDRPVNTISQKIVDPDGTETIEKKKAYEKCFAILLKNKVDLNIPDSSDETPLGYFLSAYSFKDISPLIQNGAAVNKKISNKYPLQIAIENCDADNIGNVKTLLKAGAKPNFRIMSWEYDAGTYETKKVTLLEKLKKLYHQGTEEQKQTYKEILMLLKQYGATDTLK
jgi:hypothetical protein